MRYFHSQKNFSQYKPHQSFWQKLKKKRQKKENNATITSANSNSLKNPFKKNDTNHKKSHKKIVLWLFLLLILAWITLIFTLPYFNIKKIIVEGNLINKTSEIENYTQQGNLFQKKCCFKKNYFLFDEIKLSEAIKNYFLYEKVEIRKIFPNTIKILITEKPASVIYDNHKNYFLLDTDGKIVKKINEIIPKEAEEIVFVTNTIEMATNTLTTSLNTSGSATNTPKDKIDGQNYQEIVKSYGPLPIIIDLYQKNNQENLISPEIVKAAVGWQKHLSEQGIVQAKYFLTNETDFNLKILTDKSWYILINSEYDLLTQLNNLKTILSNYKPQEYVDLRFGEKVYWK